MEDRTTAVMTLKFDNQFNSWAAVSPSALFSAPGAAWQVGQTLTQTKHWTTWREMDPLVYQNWFVTKALITFRRQFLASLTPLHWQGAGWFLKIVKLWLTVEDPFWLFNFKVWGKRNWKTPLWGRHGTAWEELFSQRENCLLKNCFLTSRKYFCTSKEMQINVNSTLF